MRALGWIAALALGAWGVHGSAMAQSDSKNDEASGAKAGAAAEQAASDPALAQIDQFIAEQKINRSTPDWKRKGVKQPPVLNFSAGKNYFWELETNVGNFVFRLLPDVAPQHVSSTIYLTRLGFYDDITFHRVINGFMAQGGDPTGSGSGGPGYEYDGEFDAKVKHDKPGLLSMANAGPGTDGSQFFITFVPTPHLDGKHTIFGELRAGKETLAAFEKRGSRSGRPTEPLKIVSAKIRVE